MNSDHVCSSYLRVCKIVFGRSPSTTGKRVTADHVIAFIRVTDHLNVSNAPDTVVLPFLSCSSSSCFRLAWDRYDVDQH